MSATAVFLQVFLDTHVGNAPTATTQYPTVRLDVRLDYRLGFGFRVRKSKKAAVL